MPRDSFGKVLSLGLEFLALLSRTTDFNLILKLSGDIVVT